MLATSPQNPPSVTQSNFIYDDVRFLRKYFKWCNVLGLFPWCLQRENSRFTCVLKCHTVMVLVLFLIGAVLTVFYKAKLVYDRMKTTQVVADVLQMIMDFSIMVTVFQGSLRRTTLWRVIFQTLEQVDALLHNKSVSIPFSKTCHKWMIISCYGLIILTNIFIWRTWSMHYRNLFYCNNFQTAVLYYQVTFIVFLVEITSIVRRRYMSLKTQIIKIFSGQVNTDEVADTRLMYKLLEDVVIKLNKTCGPHILFMLGSMLMILLNTCNWILTDHDEGVTMFLTERRLIHFVIIPITLSMCLAGIVMSCDRVEKCGEDIVTTCYILQGQVEKKALRDELILLTEYVKGLSPKFSAWGFFQVNQRLLCGFFATLTTYIIIILQFRTK